MTTSECHGVPFPISPALADAIKAGTVECPGCGRRHRSNQFEDWVKDKVVLFACGCETHHGGNPITGHLKICGRHATEIQGSDKI